MTTTGEDKELRQRVGQLEALLQEAEGFSDPEVRAKVQQIVQTLLEYHGSALARMLDHIAQAGETGRPIIDAIGEDELVGGLLLLYELHPLSLEDRIEQALDKVRPYMHSHAGDIELLGISNGVVRLRMQGTCHGCPSSAMTMKHAVEEAIYAKAPDVAGIEVEGVAEPPPAHPAQPAAAGEAGFVPAGEVLTNGQPRKEYLQCGI